MCPRIDEGRPAVEWFDPSRGQTRTGKAVIGGGTVELRAPFAGDAVVFVQRG